VVIGILYCISKSILLFQAVAYQAGLAYLYLDLITTPLMLYALVHARPAKRLADKPPEGSLFGRKLVLSCMWSIFVCIAFLLLADLIMVNQDWFVPFQAQAGVGLEQWQKRGNNFEAALVFIWSAWVYIDIPLTYSTGGIHRAPIYKNIRLVITTVALLSVTLAVMFVNSGEFGCYFKVACSASDSAAAIDAFVNNFLFPYEKVGGTWWNSQIDSTEYPLSFKIGLFFILLSMSVVHHSGHWFINTRLGNRLAAWKMPRLRHEDTKLKSERTTSTDVDVKVESMKAPLK
jgi:cation-transporting ATPase 13A3/4/5